MNPYTDDPWLRPFVTPMVSRAFNFAADVIEGGRTGGVIYAPTRTGKTRLIFLLEDELGLFKGRRELIESSILTVGSPNRLVMSEGGFWDWLLREFKHVDAGKGTVGRKRSNACEFAKSKARTCKSGRVVVLVDEAQVLELAELQWLADLFNNLERDGFRMVLFLIGSYHLSSWREELAGTKNEHIRARFFAKEHRLTGLSGIEDFRRCLRRYDVDRYKQGTEETFTQFYLPNWYAAGGRLEQRAEIIQAAFKVVTDRTEKKHFEVPMETFVNCVQHILNYEEQECDLERMCSVARDSWF